VLRRALEGRGLAPEDIDVVVLTHAHWDHVQNVSLFERARILVHPEELRYARSPHRNDHATPPWTGAILDRHDIREVCEGSEIVPGVTVLEAPGHSAGTVAVVVETDMGLAVVTGDAIQDGRVAAEGRNALVFWNEEQADRSVRKILDVADVVYPGHDRPFRMDRGRPDYLEEFALTIHHVTAETPGLGFEVWPERTREVMPGITEQTSATGRAKQ
jgi:glyoxylase-like metal-dependent hydrolase (beta-lactamase superfamily II)